MTVNSHESDNKLEISSGEVPINILWAKVMRERRIRDSRIREMGLDPDTLLLDKSGRKLNYSHRPVVSQRPNLRLVQP